MPAQDWRWSSAAAGRAGGLPLDAGPVPRPASWLGHVNAPQTEAELEAVRECIRRRLYGDSAWVERASRQLGLEASLRRAAGRPARGPPTRPRCSAA